MNCSRGNELLQTVYHKNPIPYNNTTICVLIHKCIICDQTCDHDGEWVGPGQEFVLFPPSVDDQTDVEAQHEGEGDVGQVLAAVQPQSFECFSSCFPPESAIVNWILRKIFNIFENINIVAVINNLSTLSRCQIVSFKLCAKIGYIYASIMDQHNRNI